MSSMTEMVLVGVVVGVALFWAVRAIWNSVRKGNVCTSCGNSGDCPAENNPEMLQELGQTGQHSPNSLVCPSKSVNSPKDKAKT